MVTGCGGVLFLWIPRVLGAGYCSFVVPWLIKTVVCFGESELESGKSSWERCLELQGGCIHRL